MTGGEVNSRRSHRPPIEAKKQAPAEPKPTNFRQFRFERADARTPTADTAITSEVLYQLSYVGVGRGQFTPGHPLLTRPSGLDWRREAGLAFTPVLGEDRPPLVVAPATADLEIPRREALAHEPGAAGERDRSLVAGLDVGLDPVQAQRVERFADDQSDPLAHVALVGELAGDRVAEVGALERATRDMRQVEEPEDRPIL